MEPVRMVFYTVSLGLSVTVLYLSVSVITRCDFVNLSSDLIGIFRARIRMSLLNITAVPDQSG
jgi:hypothetical protein